MTPELRFLVVPALNSILKPGTLKCSTVIKTLTTGPKLSAFIEPAKVGKTNFAVDKDVATAIARGL